MSSGNYGPCSAPTNDKSPTREGEAPVGGTYLLLVGRVEDENTGVVRLAEHAFRENHIVKTCCPIVWRTAFPKDDRVPVLVPFVIEGQVTGVPVLPLCMHCVEDIACEVVTDCCCLLGHDQSVPAVVQACNLKHLVPDLFIIHPNCRPTTGLEPR